MKTIKGLLCCVMIFFSYNYVSASLTASSFIFPVKNDLISDVTMNMIDPLSNGGGWYVNNDFGTNWNETFSGTSPGGVNYPYHPGIDYNRYDGDEDSGNDVPVYSIADGTVIRVKDMGSLGWAILIRYDLQATENLSQYIIPGTITNANIQNASSVVAMYLHLYDNTLGITGSDYRPPIPTMTVIKGQLLGHIRSDLGHLHFEIRAGSSDQTADPDSTVQVGGYYNSSQAITNFGYIDPEKFINGQFYIGRYSDGFHDDGTSQAFVDAYNEAGGESVLGIPWDNGGTIFVHNFPDENSNEAILIQDLLFTDSLNNVFWNLLVYNEDLEEVFPLTGQILDFWWENSGYNTYGPPTEAAHSETDVNNNAIIVQGFQSGMCHP